MQVMSLTYQGLMIMMLAHGLSSAALFIMCGQVYERVHTRDMRLMGGIRGQVPIPFHSSLCSLWQRWCVFLV